MIIRDAKNILKIGDLVKTNGDDENTTYFFEGYIGEIDKNHFYVWQNTKDGSNGKLLPTSKGYKYSWSIDRNNDEAEIIIKESEKNTKLINKIIGE